ncbi:MAG TPA: hypothetical protein DDZ68_16520 [Parvularcula sp.]|nr:hypothetical protein [Parvularcula sp.]HBS30201.1 hypothetical protein [Parvularcula sp.]HBS36813.1 hypothetical protein [Parvularcula sp.]
MRNLWYLVLGPALLSTACSTAPSAREALTQQGFPADGVTYFVSFKSDGEAAAVFSGSAVVGDKKFKATGAREFYRSSSGGAAVIVKAPKSISAVDLSTWYAAKPSARVWIDRYSRSLDAVRAKVFGPAAPSVSVTLTVAPPRSDFELVSGAPVEGDKLRLEFAARDALFSEFYRALTSATFAHETHHAYWGYYQWKERGGANRGSELGITLGLREAAAELFGICVGLDATNVQDRISQRNHAADNMGGVFSDKELQFLLSGGGEYSQTRGKPVSERALIRSTGPIIANTIWTSVIGADYMAEYDRESGRKLAALCTPENLGSPEGFFSFVRRFAEDGVDAPHLPEMTLETKDAGSKRLRAAIDRWRDENGLAKRYDVEGVVGEDRLKGIQAAGDSR